MSEILKTYTYKAMSQAGGIVRGSLAARDDMHLNELLAASKFELLTCKPVPKYHDKLSKLLKRVPVRDLIQLFVQLELLQVSQIPLLQSLQNVREATSNQYLHDALVEVHQTVSDGGALSDAMKSKSEIFDSLSIAIVAAGEETGDLVASCRYIVRHLKWVDHMKRRVSAATRYPMFIMVVVLVAIVVMMAVVVPQITQFFEFLSDDDLPFLTIALVITSDFFRAWWWAIGLGLSAIAALFVIGRFISSAFTYKTDFLLLRLPIFGILIRKINISRFMQTISALYSAGIPFLDAIETAGEIVSNQVLRKATNDIWDGIKEGKEFSEVLLATGEFPEMVPLMVKTAEETGRMAEILKQISEFYNNDVDEEIEKMTAMIEPGLTVILGGMILWIAVGVFGPIYALFETIDF